MSQDPEIAGALALLDEIGAEDVAHPRGTLADHLHGTYDILRRWDCTPQVYRAGLYHSVYGTDVFQTVTLAPDARDKVAAAIGSTRSGSRTSTARSSATASTRTCRWAVRRIAYATARMGR